MHVSRKWVIALALSASCPAVGQLAATRPATATAATTPRDALRSLNQAMRSGDEQHIRALFDASTPVEVRMIDADAAMAGALARLRAAAVKRFGVKHADVVTGDSDAAGADSITRIETADIDVHGDVATVTYHDEKNAQQFVLKKIDGAWRIPVSELGKPLSPAALDQRLGDLAVQRSVIDDVAARILQGQYQTPESARDAWHEQILKSATSQPATRPAN
jgi:hypothetical protein